MEEETERRLPFSQIARHIRRESLGGGVQLTSCDGGRQQQPSGGGTRELDFAGCDHRGPTLPCYANCDPGELIICRAIGGLSWQWRLERHQIAAHIAAIECALCFAIIEEAQTVLQTGRLGQAYCQAGDGTRTISRAVPSSEVAQWGIAVWPTLSEEERHELHVILFCFMRVDDLGSKFEGFDVAEGGEVVMPECACTRILLLYHPLTDPCRPGWPLPYNHLHCHQHDLSGMAGREAASKHLIVCNLRV
eukprot:TRINITY_DN21126_c0_g1_i1.p1 TRINITY_DN21126_c0_g1~~TRINITY_DN21126_c0_g1_i1.p1  ORF type:complete len:249 (-),score=14.24 TRINITY_DN21126_c0_g1_i1:444-1190(-)